MDEAFENAPRKNISFRGLNHVEDGSFIKSLPQKKQPKVEFRTHDQARDIVASASLPNSSETTTQPASVQKRNSSASPDFTPRGRPQMLAELRSEVNNFEL